MYKEQSPGQIVQSLWDTAHIMYWLYFVCLSLLIQVFCVQRKQTLTRLYIHCCILLIVMYWSYLLSITTHLCFLCAKNKHPDQIVHSLLDTAHIMYWLYFLCITINSGFLCAKNKHPDQTVHSLLHTAHSNALIIFYCLLLLIYVFCVQRTNALARLYIHCCKLLIVKHLLIFYCLLLLI